MKKNGFTLVELLAVIALLGLVIVLVAPIILSTSNEVQEILSDEQKKGLKDAGKLVGIDLDDYTSDIYNCKEFSWIETKCVKDTNWTSVTLSVEELIEHDYFNDDKFHCSGNIIIEKTNTSYKVTFNDVKC